MPETNKERLLRIEAVMDRVGLGRSSIHQRVKAGTFPPAIKFSRRYCAWTESSIDAWIQAQVSLLTR
jgi:prophage regulatory protein